MERLVMATLFGMFPFLKKLSPTADIKDRICESACKGSAASQH